MKIEIDFNERIYDEQIKILYKEAYKSENAYFKNSLLFNFIIFSCSILLIINNNNLGYFLLILGILFSSNYVIFKIKKFRLKNKLKKESQAIKELYSKKPKAVLEITKENFYYSDFKSEKVVKWEDFESYKIIKNNLLLFSKSYDPFIFGRTELGKSNYDQLVKLIKSRCNN